MKTFVPSSGFEDWELLKYAVPVVFNSSTNSSFSCVCKSGPYFQFHNSIVQSRRNCNSFDALFSRSKNILQPMLQLVNVDLETDQMDIEHSLGLRLFDAIVHLVALSSTTLHNHFGSLADVSIDIDLSVQSGMNASIQSEGLFVGRAEEVAKFNRCIQPVFRCDDLAYQGSLVLVHGIPGVGKSRLAKQQFELLQRHATGKNKVFCYAIQGRGSESVRNGLFKMGLALSHELQISTDICIDDTHICIYDLLPKLRDFLTMERFVILADDADMDAFTELLKYVPKSCKPCSLILTSQFGNDIIKHILLQIRQGTFPFKFCMHSDANIKLDIFKNQTSLELVGRTCLGLQYEEFRRLLDLEEKGVQRDAHDKKDQKFEFMWSLRNWLFDVLESDCANLPIAVQIFSLWYEQEALHYRSDPFYTKARWNVAVREEIIEDEALSGNRGIKATVRLAMHTLAGRYPQQLEACRQLLGLLSLCPPKTPWSLFDGGIWQDGNGTKKSLSTLLVRGARVEVTGKPLKFVCPIGERCKIMRLASGRVSVVPKIAFITSDLMVAGKVRLQCEDGKCASIPIEDLEFEPHIVGKLHSGRAWRVASHVRQRDCFMLEFAMPLSAVGIKFTINKPGDHNLHQQQAVLMSHYVLDVRDVNPKSQPTISVRLCHAATQAKFDKMRYSQLQAEGWIADFSLREKEQMDFVPPGGILSRKQSPQKIRRQKHLAKSLQELQLVRQKSIAATALLHAVAETSAFVEQQPIADCTGIFIHGATGPYAPDINGVFIPVREKNESGERISYIKWGDDSMCIEHLSGFWQVKRAINKGIDDSYAVVTGESALEDCVSQVWRVWDGNEFKDQPRVKILTEAEMEGLVSTHEIANDNSKATDIFIHGATGPYAPDINGFFIPVREKNERGERISYIKWGDDSMCIEHLSGMWQVKNVKDQPNSGEATFFAHVIGDCALEDCVTRVWRVWGGNEFTDQPCVTMLTGAEAKQKISIFFPEFQLELQHAQLPPEVCIVDRRIFRHPDVELNAVDSPIQPIGRVFAYHPANPLKTDTDNDIVSVIFGCDTGHMSVLKPGAILKRFKACHVCVRPALDILPALQCPIGLCQVADALCTTGLVQVDYIARTFSIHQALQKAIVRCLNLNLHGEHMVSVLQARFGEHGDHDFNVDSRLFGVMQEILHTANDVVCNMRIKGLPESRPFWCCGMFLYLRKISLIVHGAFGGSSIRYSVESQETGLQSQLLRQARVSLVGDMVYAHLLQNGCTSEESCMPLNDLLNQVPYVQDYCYDVDGLKDVCFDLCSHAYLSVIDLPDRLIPIPNAEELYAEQLHNLQEQITLSRGLSRKLFKQIPKPEKKEFTSVSDGKVWARPRDSDIVLQWQTDENWRFQLLRWNFPPQIKMTLEHHTKRFKELLHAYDTQDDDSRRWEVAVALGNQYVFAANMNKNDVYKIFSLRSIMLYKRALRMHLDTLGEQHSHTAQTIYLMGTAYLSCGKYHESIVLQEWAIRLRQMVLGDHCDTAKSLSRIGNSFEHQEQYENAISPYRRALDICGRLFGPDMKHPFCAQIIMRLSRTYHFLGLNPPLYYKTELKEAHYAESDRLSELGMQILQETLGDCSNEYQRWEEHTQEWQREREYFDSDSFGESTPDLLDAKGSECAVSSPSVLMPLLNKGSRSQDRSDWRWKRR
jgi:tetratricopeptide (TPR) repeat protein